MIEVPIQTQPDDETCGPTSLQAVYNFYGDTVSLKEVIRKVKKVKSGGTIAAYLATHALNRGYDATIYVYNLNLFDPTWFDSKTGNADPDLLLKKLKQQRKYFSSKRDLEATKAYMSMLSSGGIIKFIDLNLDLLKKLFQTELPIITGLSATYLYQSARERTNRHGESIYDDVRGDPCGHFVVLCGFNKSGRQIIVADPHRMNPISHDNYYQVNRSRLVNSIMLGVLTYDSNLLIVSPKAKQ